MSVGTHTPCESIVLGQHLESIAPAEAVKLYLDYREEDARSSTIATHRSRLAHFIDWCDEIGVGNMNALNGPLLYEFRSWRRDQEDVGKVALRSDLSTLRVFLDFCESIEAVELGLSEKIELPKVDEANGEGVRTEILGPERADEILEYLRKFEYASFDHAMIELLWHSGMRIGELRALDVSDFDYEKGSIELVDRPETDTPLKNKTGGERFNSLNEGVCEVLSDYIDSRRHGVTDDYGRNPLFTTKQGRPSTSTIRRSVYRVTQPCLVGECPHDRDPESCEAAGRSSKKCPSGLRPHDIRRGVITRDLSEDVPEEAVSDRTNVSADVFDKHYDQRGEEQKMEQRRKYYG